MPFQNVHTQRLYRQVAAQVVSLINSGEFKVGDRLPAERDLCMRLGVSRPSVREALIALEVEKIVEVRSGSGIYVLPPPQRVEPPPGGTIALGPFDVVRARYHLEPEIAVQAIRNATPEQMENIAECLAIMRTCRVGKPGLIEADRRFHLAIAEASGNPAYVMLLDMLWQHRTTPLYYQLENHFLSNQVWQKSMDEHEAIYDAIRNKDPAAAASAMQLHMRNAENRMASKLD